MTRHLLLLAMVCAVALTPRAARGDVPPPEGIKRVAYRFRVEGAAAFPDYVLIAFPWSTSSGRPTKEHARLDDGKLLFVGTRSGSPRIYAMRRAAYDAFLASYKPPEDNYEDPALRALFAGPDVRACDAAPTVRHDIDEDDPRAEVTEVLRVVVIDDAHCDLEAPPVAESTATPKSGGCAGCQSSAGGSWAPGALASLLALLLARRSTWRARRRAIGR